MQSCDNLIVKAKKMRYIAVSCHPGSTITTPSRTVIIGAKLICENSTIT